MIQIDNFYITLSMGRGNWKSIPEINDTKNEELNSIGYTGKINNKKITFQEYFDIEFRHKTKFKIELLSINGDTFIERYLVTRVKI